jgi:DNA-binding CsgD family transcriptional regulator
MLDLKDGIRKSNWYLEGDLSNGEKWVINIDKNPFIVGRNEDCNLSILSKTVSRKHAEIFKKMDGPFLRDLKSKNGTFLNEQLLNADAKLKDGDIIHFGDVKFKFFFKDDRGSTCDSGTIFAGSPKKHDDFASHYYLTKREEEILILVLQGKSTKEIADSICVSTGTAKNHILNIFKKTDAHSKFELLTMYNNFNSKK